MDQSQNTNTQTPPPGHKGFLTHIEEEIGKVYAKITFHLPAGLKEFIVKFGPWITLILMLIAIPAILLALGITAFLSPIAMQYGGYHMGGFYMVGGLVTLLALILEAMALPGLFKRQMSGWRLLLYSVLVSAIGSLLSGSWFGFIVGTALSLYVLFEVKSYYK
jgi:hypothetical protein